MKKTKENGFIATLEPEKTKILVLGSFPGEESRKNAKKWGLDHYYYANKSNKFWDIIFKCIGEEKIPENYTDKITKLTEKGICLWDLIEKCETTGSADSNIQNATPNNLSEYINKKVLIIINGKTILRKFSSKFESKEEWKNLRNDLKVAEAQSLPSTSAANTHQTLEEKKDRWKDLINKYL